MKLGNLRLVSLSSLLLCVATTFTLFAQDNSRYTIPNSKLGFVATAKDIGPEVASKQVTIYVWLRLHNGDSLRELVEQQYDPSSANYKSWLTPDQFNSSFAPTAENVAAVKEFLAAHNLSVLSVGERNMYVKAQGSIADAQSAFSVQIHKFNALGRTYRANTTDPVMEGPAGALVSRVGGLSDYRLQPHVLRPVNPATGRPFAAVPFPPPRMERSSLPIVFRAPSLRTSARMAVTRKQVILATRMERPSPTQPRHPGTVRLSAQRFTDGLQA